MSPDHSGQRSTGSESERAMDQSICKYSAFERLVLASLENMGRHLDYLLSTVNSPDMAMVQPQGTHHNLNS